MKRHELMKELKKRGIPFKNTDTKADMQALYDQSETMIETVKESLSGADKMTAEELLEGATRTEDGAVRPSGVIIPTQVLTTLRPSQYKYVADCNETECRVLKLDTKGREEYVRTYSEDRHGDNFKELAMQFIGHKNEKEQRK